MNFSPGRIVGIALGAARDPRDRRLRSCDAARSAARVSVRLRCPGEDIRRRPPRRRSLLPETGASALAARVRRRRGRDRSPTAGDPTPCRSAVPRNSSPCSRPSSRCRCPPTATGRRFASALPTTPTTSRYSAEGSRTLQVSPGDTWSERDVVRAVLLASSNNHADTLARWAFGGVDAYVDGRERLARRTGVHRHSRRRRDRALGRQRRHAPKSSLASRRWSSPIPNSRRCSRPPAPPASAPATCPTSSTGSAEEGVRAITRSYTDQAGVSFMYTTRYRCRGRGLPAASSGR